MTADLHSLAGAYVLDAVDDIERAAFDRHLAACETCATEVAELREVTAILSGPVAEPPAALRANVLAAVSRTRQVGPSLPPEVRRGHAPPVDQRWRRATLATIAAAALAIAGTWAVMDQRVRDERVQVQALQSERERIYAVMNARDVLMRGTDLPEGGRIAAAVSPTERGGVAMLAGLPDPPAGQTYQMWLFTGGKATSAVVLPVGVTGGTMFFDWVPGADTFGITREPVGGSASPTTDPLGTITLS